MRQTTKKQLPLTSVGIQHQHSKELEAVSRILDDALELAERAQQDLLGGRRGDVGRKGMTGDQTIRVAVLMQIHRLSYRALAFQLVDSSLFRRFARLAFGKEVKVATLQSNVKRLSAETWEAINRVLLKRAEAAGIESGRKSRTDCTVVESNIHQPSDSSLLWDCVRVVTRLVDQATELMPTADWSFFHDHRRRAKRRSFEIQFPPRSKGDKTKHRERAYRDLLNVAEQTQSYGVLADLKLANAKPCSVEETLKIEALRSELRE